MDNNNLPHIVVYGSPIDGINFRGPFPNYEAALEYAEWSEPDEAWWIAELTPIEPDWAEQLIDKETK